MTIRPLGSPNVFQLSRLVTSSSNSSKLTLPVERQWMLYSRLKHVHGVPSGANSEGLPLHKLRALDNYIDRLIRLKGSKASGLDVTHMSEGELDRQISIQQQKLHQALKIISLTPLAGSQYNDIGLAVDFVA